jgi:serine phosphatase RsbU (regulator of sigma subunit)
LQTLRTEIEKVACGVRPSARPAHGNSTYSAQAAAGDVPQIAGCELAVSWQPAAGVGGDCFDAIAFGPHRLALSIADVVGKGIPAALLMSNLQAAVRAFATEATSPAELCQQVNRILCGNIAEGRFISFSAAPSTRVSGSDVHQRRALSADPCSC